MSESLRSLLECPVCTRVPHSDNILICKQGHNVCRRCYNRLRVCPIARCKFPFPEIRNLLLENIVEQSDFMLECDNADKGCNFVDVAKDVRKHKEECGFNPVEEEEVAGPVVTLSDFEDDDEDTEVEEEEEEQEEEEQYPAPPSPPRAQFEYYLAEMPPYAQVPPPPPIRLLPQEPYMMMGYYPPPPPSPPIPTNTNYYTYPYVFNPPSVMYPNEPNMDPDLPGVAPTANINCNCRNCQVSRSTRRIQMYCEHIITIISHQQQF